MIMGTPHIPLFMAALAAFAPVALGAAVAVPPPAFLPTRPITVADLATLTEKVPRHARAVPAVAT